MMKREQHDEQRLWVRFVSGDPLTQAEGRRLTQWVDDAELKDAFLDDLETDRVLRSLGAMAATEERFIDATLARLEREALQQELERPPQRIRAASRWSPRTSLLAAAAAAFLGGLGIGLLRTPEPVLLTDQPFVSAVSNGGGKALPARLGAGPVEVSEGGARLAFDSGATLDVEGPARLELVDEDELYFLDGRAQASVPADVAAFVVRTPTTRMVESGTTFEILVEEFGKTEVRLISGELSVEPGRDGHWTGRDQRLSLDTLHLAHIVPLSPGVDQTPVTFEAEGDTGNYAAMIINNGESVEFGGRASFRHARAKLAQLLSDSPDSFPGIWNQVAPTGGPAFIHFEGRPGERFRIDELDELGHAISVWVTTDGRTESEHGSHPVDIGFHEFTFEVEDLSTTVKSSGGTSASDIFFGSESGFIRINGQQIRFDNPHELRDLIEIRTEPLRAHGLTIGDHDHNKLLQHRLILRNRSESSDDRR